MRRETKKTEMKWEEREGKSERVKERERERRREGADECLPTPQSCKLN